VTGGGGSGFPGGELTSEVCCQEGAHYPTREIGKNNLKKHEEFGGGTDDESTIKTCEKNLGRVPTPSMGGESCLPERREEIIYEGLGLSLYGLKWEVLGRTVDNLYLLSKVHRAKKIGERGIKEGNDAQKSKK